MNDKERMAQAIMGGEMEREALDAFERSLVGKNIRLFIPLDDSSQAASAIRELQKMVNELVEFDYRQRHNASGHVKAVENEFHYLRDFRQIVERARLSIEPSRKKMKGVICGTDNVTRLER